MNKPTVFTIGIFHTQMDPEKNSHCAFSCKAIKLPSMIQPHGWRVVEFSNEGSGSCAEQKVTMLTKKEFDYHYPDRKSVV